MTFPSARPIKCWDGIQKEGTSNASPNASLIVWSLNSINNSLYEATSFLGCYSVSLQLQFWHSNQVLCLHFRGKGSHDIPSPSLKTWISDNTAVRTSKLAVCSMSEVCNPLLPSNKNIHDQNKRVTCHFKSRTESNLKSMLATNCELTFS